MRPVILIGAGGLAREVVALLEGSADHKPIGLLDDDTALHGKDIAGLPVLGGIDSVREHTDSDILVCTGSGRSRRLIIERLVRLGVDSSRYATVIAPDVRVPSDCAVGSGSILLAGVVLTASVSIGRHAVLMPHAVCTHDDRVGDYATLCAGVTLGGSVEIGDEAYLGMNSAVKQNVRVGTCAVLGMGSVLLADLPADEVWVGNPARAIEYGESRE
ncbi:NeuD/PglB/VioB family sugar acetyltransferase [Nocardia sp. 348MFTsu5.1]|uniref:NeuD/PglB/VioB family sugar acetyltransferase n=1 Tax=Nocardia sp. 348MFTsu5.1 TaxID=1172185 RepID=UPI000369BD56|nr:NeuD/PglB/VioB family sugar acetyltransferase [Nocardia sp. 348MFTsu5.1]